MINPLFSVVVPTYNRAEKLLRCLRSLNAQTYTNFEVIICDDGSDDQTKEIVKNFRSGINFKKLYYFFDTNWGGPARPRNKGVKESTAEWICFLDADDAWYPEKLQSIIPFLIGFDLIYHDFNLVGPSGKLRPMTSRQLKPPVFNDQMLNGHNGCIINSGVCIRKSIVEKVGGVSEDRQLIGVEDADLWLRIARITDLFKYIPLQLGYYHLDGGNLTIYNNTMINKLQYLFSIHSPYLQNNRLISQAKKTNDYHAGRIKEMMGNYREALVLHISSLKSPSKKLAIRSIFWIVYLYGKLFFFYLRGSKKINHHPSLGNNVFD